MILENMVLRRICQKRDKNYTRRSFKIYTYIRASGFQNEGRCDGQYMQQIWHIKLCQKTRTDEPVGRSRHMQDLKQMLCEDVDWIEPTQDKEQWLDLVNTIMNIIKDRKLLDKLSNY
jgi:hypothetical protein